MWKNLALLFFVGVCICVNTFAQKKNKGSDIVVENTAKPVDSTLIRAFSQAIRYGDLESAKNTAYLILAEHPQDTAWQDSLVQLYFALGAYPQCVLAGRDYLAGHPYNYMVMEFVGASEYALKQYKDALATYEKLFSHSHAPYHAYQLAINQYMMKRIGECESSVQLILADFESDKQTVVIALNNGESQDVPVKAAAWNLRGVMLKDGGKLPEAKACFEQALKIFPQFALAQANVQAVTPKPVPSEVKPEQPAQKTTPKMATPVKK